MFDASSELLSAINSFQANVDDVHKSLTGHLVIALFDKTLTNPEGRIPETFALFDQIAPEVTIEIHAEPVNVIESGVLSGRFHLAIIPTHRRSSSIEYCPLYSEQMYLYCGMGHGLFGKDDPLVTEEAIRQCKYAGIGFHSPNMIVSQNLGLKRSADVFDEEALAALILSGRYLGFLPDHYARAFVERGVMWRLRPDAYHYQSNHAAIVRHFPRPSRLVERFLDCLRSAHGATARPVPENTLI